MKVRFIKRAPKSPVGFWELDEVHESPDVLWLVELGLAVPADDETAAKWAERKVRLDERAAARKERLKEEIAKLAAADKEAETERHEEFEQLLKAPPEKIGLTPL